ncbi:MAG: hypothetical protein WDN28_06025 [Chthoniobacter sp.]
MSAFLSAMLCSAASFSTAIWGKGIDVSFARLNERIALFTKCLELAGIGRDLGLQPLQRGVPFGDGLQGRLLVRRQLPMPGLKLAAHVESIRHRELGHEILQKLPALLWCHRFERLGEFLTERPFPRFRQLRGQTRLEVSQSSRKAGGPLRAFT